MTTDLATMIARRFIARRDGKAIQGHDGIYRPVKQRGADGTETPVPWTMDDLAAHLEGRETFGNYVLDSTNHCKFFCLDIDLRGVDAMHDRMRPGWVWRPDIATLGDTPYTPEQVEQWFVENTHVYPSASPRDDWHDRTHPGRNWYKFQLRALAEMFSSRIHRELQIPVACTYSGNKGVHVYGFTGYGPAAEARWAGESILRSFPTWKEQGPNWVDTNDDPIDGFGNVTIELFPKQDEIKEGGWGNLIRLPLGVNRKSPADPTFFLDQRAPHDSLVPHPDPLAVLTSGNPWL